MELETIAITLGLLVVVILQIVTIALVLRNGANKRQQIKSTPTSSERNDRRDNQDFRRTQRPHQEMRQKPQSNGPKPTNTNNANASDNVEKSLRDINLRLKNAERDQEFARRKIQDAPISNAPTTTPRREPNNDRKNVRDGRDGRRDNRDGRDNNRRRSGNWPQDRTREFNRKPNENASPISSVSPENSASEDQIIMPTTPDIAAVADIGTNDDSLQHGRKFTAKRRPYGDDNGSKTTENTTSSEQLNSSDSQSAVSEQHSESAASSSGNEAEIRFGRR